MRYPVLLLLACLRSPRPARRLAGSTGADERDRENVLCSRLRHQPEPRCVRTQRGRARNGEGRPLDGVLGKPAQVDLRAYGPKLQELQRSRGAAAAAQEKKAGEAVLAKAAGEKGASKTPAGAVVIPLRPGTGASPSASDKVKVHYHGTLTDGTVFDSSVQRGEPITFPLDGVIRCWTEGVQQMKVGGKARLVCPSDTAYGDRGAPPRIKPGATLVFEVELLEIVK